MNEKIDKNFRKWLESLAKKWDLPIEQIALNLGDVEITNRVQNYPKVSAALLASPFEIQQFGNAVRRCWVMRGRFDGIRFNRFINNTEDATKAIRQLIKDFPEDDANASKRIKQFVESAILLGFSTPTNSFDWAGAASLASIILTSLYPVRFVDYRRERWRRFAEALAYKLPPTDASHGDWIIWAGQFAKTVSETNVYEEFCLTQNNDYRIHYG